MQENQRRVGVLLALLTVHWSSPARAAHEPKFDGGATQGTNEEAPTHTAKSSLRSQSSYVYDDPTDPWVPGTGMWGTRGIWHLDSAHGGKQNSLVFALSDFSSFSHSLLSAKDTNFYQAQRLQVAWTALPGLELGLSEVLINNYNTTFFLNTLQVLGDAQLNAKYTITPLEKQPLGVGVFASILVPTAVRSSNLAFKALTFTLNGLATYQFERWLELTANAGFSLNNSSELASNPYLLQRFVFNISSHSTFNYGVGAVTRLDLGTAIGLGPFAELTGQTLFGAPQDSGPFLATLGIKAYLERYHLLELTLGADVRVTGAPNYTDASSQAPGVAPWTLFAMLSLHLFDHAQPQIVMGRQACFVDSDCGSGETCHDNYCILTTQVIKEIKQEMFTLSGQVMDSLTHRPVQDSQVIVGGFEKTPIEVDYRTGAFTSFPVPCGPGLFQVKVAAPNHKPYEQTLARGKPNEDIKLSVVMTPDGASIGKLEGRIKDGRTGKPIPHSSLYIISLAQKISTDARGHFSANVRPGRYDIIISAPHYITQRKQLVIRDADVIILNVDMQTLGS